MSNYLTWIEINKNAFKDNVSQFKNLLGKNIKLLSVIKSNAYGHGLLPISKIIKETNIDFLGVISIEEAIFLKKQKIKKPILIMGYVPFNYLEEIVKNNFRITVYNQETIEKLSYFSEKLSKKSYLHLKLETGTYRQGILKKNLPSILNFIKKNPLLQLEGISTHFANIEDTTNHIYAKFQLNNFLKMSNEIEIFGLNPIYKHTTCSAATILFPETYFNLVRIGISLYGLWPSKEIYISYIDKNPKNHLELKPILTWKTKIAQIKEVPKNSFIGYGCTYKTTSKIKIAILPIGYYDGYPRNLSNIGYVLVKGKRCPIRGRICMNIMIIDITNVKNVKIEDEVVLIGNQKEEKITAEQLASLSGTISYEIISRIPEHIPRIIN
ncbi:MAG: alanine racemase [bacterium]